MKVNDLNRAVNVQQFIEDVDVISADVDKNLDIAVGGSRIYRAGTSKKYLNDDEATQIATIIKTALNRKRDSYVDELVKLGVEL